MSAPALNGILESALFVRDLVRARVFYEGVLGLTAGTGGPGRPPTRWIT